MRKSRPKKQHYVPQLHLRYFVGHSPAGMIWTYDKQKGSVRPSVPKETAAETNFYSVEDEDGRYNDMVENWLSGVESRAAATYGALLRGEIPQGQARADFSTFLASLHTRTPTQLRKGGEVIGTLMQTIMKATARNPQRFMEQYNAIPGVKPIDLEEARRTCEFTEDTSLYTVNVDRRAALMVLGASDEIQRILFGMGWSVVGTEDAFFITSDHPVAKYSPVESHSQHWGDGGFLNPKLQVSFPLSPSRSLVLTGANDWQHGVMPVTRNIVQSLNRLNAVFADRFLFADRRSDDVLALAEEFRETRERVSVAGTGKFAPVKVKRRLKPR